MTFPYSPAALPNTSLIERTRGEFAERGPKSTIVMLGMAVVALVDLSPIFLKHRVIIGATPSDCASFQSLQIEFEQKFAALPLNSKPGDVNSPYLALLTEERDAYLTLYKHTLGYFATDLFLLGQAIDKSKSQLIL